MLKLQNLTVGYGGKTLVTLPALDVAPGEHCLLLGPSGSGKTTLLYAIAGLITPLSGSIVVNGTELTILSARARDAFRGKQIGIIYQTLHLVPALTVRENLLLVPYAAGLPQCSKTADALLTSLGLYALRDQLPQQLSQGQQQRVAIARAAMHSPALILGDEPTSALDDAACDAVMQLLLATAERSGASLILATHDARIKKYFAKTLTLEQPYE